MTAKGYLPLLAIGQVWQCREQCHRVKILSTDGATYLGRDIQSDGTESWEVHYAQGKCQPGGEYTASIFSPVLDLAKLIYDPIRNSHDSF